jgi:DNA-binding CsgD family transcriptional regulator
MINMGTCFEESFAGTNAIHISMKENSIFITTPEQHYCDFLRSWYIMSVPIWDENSSAGSISIISRENLKNQEYSLLLELLAYKISIEMRKRKMVYHSTLRSNIFFTKRQLEILKALAHGWTDMYLASLLNISIGTVRFHKTNIFRKLGADCCMQAIIKALKLGLMSLDDIEI